MKRTIFVVALGVFLGLIVKLFIFDILTVSGDSMMPALKNGQVVFVNKLSYGLTKPFSSEFFVQWKTPKINDVVLFLHENKMVVKRCVALSGDKLDFVSGKNANGDVFMESEGTDTESEVAKTAHSTSENWILRINEKNIPLTASQFEALKQFEKVPENCVFVLGDNYKTSVDSRNYGFVRAENIVGKVVSR